MSHNGPITILPPWSIRGSGTGVGPKPLFPSDSGTDCDT